jgi:hypothetical protein
MTVAFLRSFETHTDVARHFLVRRSREAIRKSISQLEDVLERWESSLDPSVDEASRQGWQEYERGETVPLDSIVW